MVNWIRRAVVLRRFRIYAMKIKYFKETDTALLEFLEAPVDETRAIGENVFFDLDELGNLVSMTIEHASSVAALRRVSVEDIGGSAQ